MGSRRFNLPGGLLIPERCQYSTLTANTGAATTSDYTESTPRPGLPVVSDQWSQLRLEVSGEQGYDMDARVQNPGQPSRSGLQVAVKLDSEGSSAWRGWESPSVVQQAIPLAWGTANTQIHHVTTIPSTQKLAIAYLSGTSAKLATIDPASSNAVTLASGTMAAGGDWNYPAIVCMPGSERLICVYGGASYYSDDLGGTWTTLAQFVTTEDTSDYGRTVAVVHRGNIVLFVESLGTAETIHHLVSTDGGASFSLVQSTAALGVRVNAVSNDDGIHVVWVDSGTALEYRRLGTPFEALDTVAQTAIASGASNEECCIWADGSGTIYVVGGDYRGFVYHSIDGGVTWTSYRTPAYTMPDSADRIGLMSASYSSGAGYVVCGFNNGSTWTTTHAAVLMLGGWSSSVLSVASPTVPMHFPQNRWGYGGRTPGSGANAAGSTYFPWDVPGSQGYTAAGAGTETVSNTNGSLNIVTAANARSFSKDLGANITGIVGLAHMRLVSGGSAGTQDVAVTVRIADASSFEYEAELLISSSAIVINDINSANTSTLTVSMSSYRQIRFWIGTDYVIHVQTRAAGASTWAAEATVTLTDAGATANNSRIVWGHIASATAESDWREVHYAVADTQLPKVILSVSEPLPGKYLNARPEPLPGGFGTSAGASFIAAASGPAATGETVDIDAFHDYPIEHIHAELAPGRGAKWRSTDTSEQIGCYDLGDGGWVGHSIALFVAGANFRTAVIESYNGSTWDTHATLDLAQGFSSLRYSISGYSVYPDASNGSAASRWLWEQEKRNGVIIATDGGNTYATRIVSQTSGGWQTSATGKTVIPMLRLEDVSEVGTLSGTLTCHLCSPDGLVLAHFTTIKARRYWRWRIPASQTTPTGESYYEAAVIAICRVQPFGAEVGWGNSDEAEANTSQIEDESGTIRKRSHGIERRTWTLGEWASAPGNHGPLRIGANADYVGSSETDALALTGFEDIYHHLRGLLRVTDGGALPVVAVEPLPNASNTTLTDPSRFLYGYLSSSVRGTRATGSMDDTAGAGEVVRVDDIVIREIV